MQKLCIAAIATLLSGCAGLGPTMADNWQQQVNSALPQGDAPAHFESAAHWVPDTLGYAEIGNLEGQAFRQIWCDLRLVHNAYSDPGHAEATRHSPTRPKLLTSRSRDCKYSN